MWKSQKSQKNSFRRLETGSLLWFSGFSGLVCHSKPTHTAGWYAHARAFFSEAYHNFCSVLQFHPFLFDFFSWLLGMFEGMKLIQNWNSILQIYHQNKKNHLKIAKKCILLNFFFLFSRIVQVLHIKIWWFQYWRHLVLWNKTLNLRGLLFQLFPNGCPPFRWPFQIRVVHWQVRVTLLKLVYFLR